MLAVCLETDIKIDSPNKQFPPARRLGRRKPERKKAGLFKARPFSALKTPVSASILRTAASKKQQKKAQPGNPRAAS
jgi:hypothetical protein